MKFKIENKAITEMSARAMESTLKSKAQWNLHNAICLSIEDSTLKIKSFLENMMFEGVLFPEHIESEGYAVINGKILINALKTMKDKVIEIKLAEGRVLINDKNTMIAVPVIREKQFENIKMEDKSKICEIDATDFLKMYGRVKKCTFSTNNDTEKFNYITINIEDNSAKTFIKNSYMEMFTTNSYIMAKAKRKADVYSGGTFKIYKKLFEKVSKIFKSASGTISIYGNSIYGDENTFIISSFGITVLIKLKEIPDFDYDEILNPLIHLPMAFSVKRKELLKSIKNMLPVANEKPLGKGSITFNVYNNKINLSTANEYLETSDRIECESYMSKPFEVTLQGNDLNKYLSSISEESITLHSKNPAAGAVLITGDVPDSFDNCMALMPFHNVLKTSKECSDYISNKK